MNGLGVRLAVFHVQYEVVRWHTERLLAGLRGELAATGRPYALSVSVVRGDLGGDGLVLLVEDGGVRSRRVAGAGAGAWSSLEASRDAAWLATGAAGRDARFVLLVVQHDVLPALSEPFLGVAVATVPTLLLRPGPGSDLSWGAGLCAAAVAKQIAEYQAAIGGREAAESLVQMRSAASLPKSRGMTEWTV
jgi:hypothetical protein